MGGAVGGECGYVVQLEHSWSQLVVWGYGIACVHKGGLQRLYQRVCSCREGARPLVRGGVGGVEVARQQARRGKYTGSPGYSGLSSLPLQGLLMPQSLVAPSLFLPAVSGLLRFCLPY